MTEYRKYWSDWVSWNDIEPGKPMPPLGKDVLIKGIDESDEVRYEVAHLERVSNDDICLESYYWHRQDGGLVHLKDVSMWVKLPEGVEDVEDVEDDE